MLHLFSKILSETQYVLDNLIKAFKSKIRVKKYYEYEKINYENFKDKKLKHLLKKPNVL